jgi:hypothetical protein
MKKGKNLFPGKPSNTPNTTVVCEENLLDTTPMKSRTQTFNPHIHKWIKRDEKTGQFCGVKKDGQPWRRVSVEENTPVVVLGW